MAPVPVHILTYHAGLIDGPDYAQNDHVALREDLKVVARLGLRVLPLQAVIDALLGRRAWSTLDGAVALTCDDGTAFDALPGREYGAHGPQPSLLGVLQDWVREDPAARAEASLTSFLIASPAARAAMDRECLFDRNDLDSDWWSAAQRTGHMAFGNHSWDHNHPTLKPLALTEYLAKLLLVPKRTDGKPRRILVPFSGAGSEVIGCLLAGWDEVWGIELNGEYIQIATARITHHTEATSLA